MNRFTKEELRVLIRALRMLAGSKAARLDYDLADTAEDLADRAELELEGRK